MCNLRLSVDKQIVIGSVLVLLLSLADGALTIWGMDRGVIEEANPVMQLLISKSPIGLMAVKLLLPVILGSLLWQIRNRSRRSVSYSLGLVLLVYSLVMIAHLHWIALNTGN